MRASLRAAAIHTARAVYALNWFDISPALIYISRQLDLSIPQLGLMTTGFYIGLATFQLLGGILASRLGNRLTATLGISILGLASIVTGLSQDLPELFASRFFAGMGSAFFFSPALGSLSEIVPRDRYTVHVGIYNGAFNIGAGTGVLGWAYLDRIMSWRITMSLGGALALALGAVSYVALMGVSEHRSVGRALSSNLKRVVASRYLWIVPVAGIAPMVAETITGQFMVYYLETGLHSGTATAGTVSSLFLFLGFIGGLVGGMQFQRTRRKMGTFIAVLVLTGALLVAVALLRNIYAVSLSLVAMGMLTVDGFSILYAIAAFFVHDRSMVSFSLAFVNFMQQVLSIAFPFAFTYVDALSGYTPAWLSMAAISFAALPLLALVGKGELRRLGQWRRAEGG
ncbi:hypothetical protein GCM10007108_15720 [Thermogymnomonas acidicola]|uniref:Major facilitator superfamily (MFS) profile domain-containing protein n=1 Tax=Thermogymnomonas acidicola TaxID=399579 RepID=A0AA37FC96_9ARCH|nr:MFS transporter [Thermogymnomonas acidicola]GGM78426.1 hypothetical protein GCM10007108_15720 [Thermogymnomonas acidicola]